MAASKDEPSQRNGARPDKRDERVSLEPLDPKTALKALLATPANGQKPKPAKKKPAKS